MNATDCARATEPQSRAVRHKPTPKITAPRLGCRGCGTSANMATILSRACHQYELRGRGALRIVVCGPATTDRNSIECLAPRPAPGSRKPRQHRFRIDTVEAAAARRQRAGAGLRRAD